MKKYLALTLLTLAGCGQLGQPYSGERTLASESEVASMSPQQLKEHWQLSMRQLHMSYMLGQKRMQQFDELLDDVDSKVPVLESPTYAQLLSIRAEVEGIEHEFKEQLMQHLNQSLDQELPINERQVALQKIQAMYQGLSEVSQDIPKQLVPVSFDHLNREIAPLQALIKTSASSVSIEELRQGWKDVVKELDHATSYISYPMLARRDYAGNLREEWSKLSFESDFVSLEKSIEHRGISMQRDLRFGKQQPKKIFPSTQRAGNIVGTEFPAKVWSLTYDDGPGGRTSQKILNHLKTHGIKATFFQLTSQAKSLSTVAKAIRDDGHDIASHSWSHLQMTRQNGATQDTEIGQAIKALSELHERPIKFYRLPYGAGTNSTAIRQRIADAGTIHVFWNVDTLDWQAQDPQQIVDRTIKQMNASSKDAGVILFHDIHERTVIASEKVMAHLKKDGRRTCGLDEIVNAINEERQACP